MDRLVCRKARVEDYQAVCDIRDDVYNGNDYLPGAYRRYCHDPRCYAYLAERNGKVIAYVRFYLLDTDGRRGPMLMSGAARTAAREEGTGVIGALGRYMGEEIREAYPGMVPVTVVLRSHRYDEAIRRGKYSIIQKWHVSGNIYKRKHIEVLAKAELGSSIGITDFLHPADFSRIVEKNYETFLQLIKLYGSHIPYGEAWLCQNSSLSSLHYLAKSEVLAVTSNTSGTPASFSIFSRNSCRGGERCNLTYLGNDLDDLLCHVRLHCARWLRIHRGATFILLVHFPLTLEYVKVRDAVLKVTGGALENINVNPEVYLLQRLASESKL